MSVDSVPEPIFEESASIIDEAMRERLEAVRVLGMTATAREVGRMAEEATPDAQVLIVRALQLLVDARKLTSNAAKLAPVLPGPRAVSSESSVPSAESSASVVYQNAAEFIERLLQKPLPEHVDQQRCDDFVREIIRRYADVTQKMRNDTVGNLEALQLYVAGMSNEEISRQVGKSVAAITQFRYKVVGMFHERGYPPERLEAMLVGVPVHEAVATAKSAPTQALAAVVEPAVHEVVIVPPAPQEAVVNEDLSTAIDRLVEPYWNDADRASLQALLHDENGDVVEAARLHLQGLMAGFAPIRPATGGESDIDTLTLAEWNTLNYLSGYNLQQGEKPLSPRYLVSRMAEAYRKKDTSFEDACFSALQRLIHKARADYRQGWYPGNSLKDDTSTDSETLTNPETQLPDREDAYFVPVLTKLLGSTVSETRHIAKLSDHLAGKLVDTHGRDFGLTAYELSKKIIAMHEKMKAKARNGHVAKDMLREADIILLQDLLGNLYANRPPKTYQEVIEKSKYSTDASEQTTATLRSRIAKNLAVLARQT